MKRKRLLKINKNCHITRIYEIVKEREKNNFFFFFVKLSTSLI